MVLNVEMVGETEVRPNNINGPVEIMGSKVHHEFSLAKYNEVRASRKKITQKIDIHWVAGTSDTCQKQLDRYYYPKNR